MTDNLQRRVLEEQSAQELFETLNEIGPLHRSAHNTHTALQQAREMMADDTDIIDLRDHAEEIARTLELLSHEAKNALDYRVAAQAERQSASAHVMTVAAHRLSILAAVFFPLVTLTSIFGMNLDSGIISTLGEESSFWVVIITGLVIGGILAALLRRRPIAQSAG
jgi:Mg2+ and Co2+ transporter CorA